MTKASRLAAGIRGEITRLANDAARKTLVGEDASGDLDRIAELRRVEQALPQPGGGTWVWAVGVAAICLGAVSVAATVPVPRVRIELDATTASVSFRLRDTIGWQGAWPVDSSLVRFQNVERAELPDFPPSPWSGRVSFDVTAEHGKASIRGFSAARGAVVMIDQTGSAVTIMAKGAPSSVELNATGAVSVSGRDASGTRRSPVTLDFPSVPADFAASGPGTGAVPVSLRVIPLGALDLRGVAISDLSFLSERVDAGQQELWLSELQAGTLSLTDTGEKAVLRDGAMLRLRSSSGTLTLLRIASDVIGVRFEGTAAGITLGSGDFARDLRPKLLEYAFHQERVGFLWGAVTFLWGLLWSARQLLAGKS